MSRSIAFVSALSLAAFVGCKEDLLDDLPDAASLDASEVPLPAGDWRCADTPYPTTALDPLAILGGVNIAGVPTGGIPVEIRRSDDDVMIGQDVTDTASTERRGTYSLSVPSGGTALRIYRKSVGGSGRLDSYQYDGIPVGVAYPMWTNGFTDEQTADFYNGLGIARDLTRGMMFFEVFDCGVPPGGTHKVAGVRVEPPPGSTVVYADPDGALNANLVETSSHGGFIVLNVSPGVVDLALRAGPLQYRSWPVRVHANSWTSGVRHP